MQLLPIEAYAALDAAQEIAGAAAKALNIADAAWRKSKSKVRAQAFQDAHDAFQAAVNRAIQRCKDADLMQRGGPIVPLDNAAAWLVQANRAARKK